jgi:hypothetical protein
MITDEFEGSSSTKSIYPSDVVTQHLVVCPCFPTAFNASRRESTIFWVKLVESQLGARRDFLQPTVRDACCVSKSCRESVSILRVRTEQDMHPTCLRFIIGHEVRKEVWHQVKQSSQVKPLPLFFHAGKNSICLFYYVHVKTSTLHYIGLYATRTHKATKEAPRFHLMHTEGVHENNYINHVVRHGYVPFVHAGSTSPTLCAVTTRCAAARLNVWSHRLYISYAVRLHCSSPGRNSSTSTTSCAATTRLLVAPALPHQHRVPRLLVSRSHRLYINNVVRRDYSSSGRTGSTSTTLCAVTTRLPVALTLRRLRRAS